MAFYIWLATIGLLWTHASKWFLQILVTCFSFLLVRVRILLTHFVKHDNRTAQRRSLCEAWSAVAAVTGAYCVRGALPARSLLRFSPTAGGLGSGSITILQTGKRSLGTILGFSRGKCLIVKESSPLTILTAGLFELHVKLPGLHHYVAYFIVYLI